MVGSPLIPPKPFGLPGIGPAAGKLLGAVVVAPLVGTYIDSLLQVSPAGLVLPQGWVELWSCNHSVGPSGWRANGNATPWCNSVTSANAFPLPANPGLVMVHLTRPVGTRHWVTHGIQGTGEPAPAGTPTWRENPQYLPAQTPQVQPEVHPLLNPIGVPRALPSVRPRARPAPRPGPADMPGQAREGGYASPRRPLPELHPQVDVTPRGASVTAPPRGPARKPPRRGEKEKKTAGEKALAKLATAAFALTEFEDLLDALIDAIPGSPHNLPTRAKPGYLFANIDDVDAADAINNIIANFVEDFFAGNLSAAAQKKLRDMGATSTTVSSKEKGQLGSWDDALAELGL